MFTLAEIWLLDRIRLPIGGVACLPVPFRQSQRPVALVPLFRRRCSPRLFSLYQCSPHRPLLPDVSLPISCGWRWVSYWGGGVEAQVFFLKWGFIPEELIRSQPYSTIVTEQGVTLSIETPLPTSVTNFRPCSCTAGSALRRKYDVPVGVRR